MKKYFLVIILIFISNCVYTQSIIGFMNSQNISFNNDSSLVLNGINEYATLRTDNFIKDDGNSFSFMFKPLSLANDSYLINGDSLNLLSIQINNQADSDNYGLIVTINTVEGTLSANVLIPLSDLLNKWQCMLVTIEPNNFISIYINGVASGGIDISENTLISSVERFSFGRNGELDNDYFLGNIDEIRFFSDVKTFDEASELCDINKLTNLINWYRCENIINNKIIDYLNNDSTPITLTNINSLSNEVNN